MLKKILLGLPLCCLCLLSGCKNYSISLNDNTLYTPAGVFKDFDIADAALNDCVTQTLFDEKITRAEDLTQLNCSNAGVKSLTGLSKFFALTAVNLSENTLNDIDELGKLGRLEVLLLNKNAIKSSAPLLTLLHLRKLDLSNNPIKDCDNLQQLKKNLAHNKTEFILDGVCKN